MFLPQFVKIEVKGFIADGTYRITMTRDIVATLRHPEGAKRAQEFLKGLKK